MPEITFNLQCNSLFRFLNKIFARDFKNFGSPIKLKFPLLKTSMLTRLTFAFVKLFSIIFLVYILLLSTVPCCAFDFCNDELQENQTTDKHEHDDDCKNCSPFAVCSNCVGFTVLINAFRIERPQQMIEQTFTVYTQSYLPPYISSFWQPPKVI